MRSAVYIFSRMGLFFLLAVPPAFSQRQQNPLPPTGSELKPEHVVVSETNDRIMQLARASQVQQGDYVIGSGDLLGIDVFDVPELSRDVRVNETGYISLPLLPTKINAAGLTPFQLQDKLAELLQTNGLVSVPQVSITLKEQHSEPITVIGEVKSPMVIQAIRQTTLLQALSQAGGISDDAGGAVIVTRTGQQASSGNPSATPAQASPETFTINLTDLLDSGDSRFNIPLIGGDVVSVPRAGIIYVVGAVNRPGGFVLQQNDRDIMTSLKMLSLAGGATSTAKTKNAVILRSTSAISPRSKPGGSLSMSPTSPVNPGGNGDSNAPCPPVARSAMCSHDLQ